MKARNTIGKLLSRFISGDADTTLHRTIVFGIVSFTLSFGATTQAAPSGTLLAQHSNKCLDVPAGSTSNGVQLVQWSCHRGANQQFELIELGGGYYNVRAVYSGKCLNVYGGSANNGAQVVQWSCSGGNGSNDMWRLEAQNGGHRLIARHSGRCLNVSGGSRQNGGKLIQWACSGGGNETFVVSALATPPLTEPQPQPEPEPHLAELFGTIMLRHSGKCLNVTGASTANGANIIQWTCTGASHDRFAVRQIGDNAYHIVAQHSGKCLNIEGASQANRAKVVQWPCTNAVNANDSFRVESFQDGHRIIARHSGRCLNLSGGTINNNGGLIQYDCQGGDNEIFTIGALGAAQGGHWTAPIRFPLVPVAAGVMPTGEVLAWSAYGRMNFGGNNGYTLTALYDPDSGVVTERRVDETGHDMFCPGTSQMADGRFMVTGGSSSGRVSIYEPVTSTWTRAPNMNNARAYHSSTIMGDGSVMVVGGSWGGGIGDKGAEVYRDNRWTRLSGVSTLPMVGADPKGQYRSDNHMWLFAWTGNRVIQAGPSRQMHLISTAGNGSVTPLGARGNDDYAMNGSAVMYEPGRILTTGGAPAYDNGQATTNANIVEINGSTSTTSEVESMKQRRAFHHSVVLPDGKVLVLGGQEVSIPFSDARSSLTPELFDPISRSFTSMAPMAIPRTYHSVALLMADARVFVGGGGLCGGCQTNHPNAEIFTPPYLLTAEGALRSRPRITDAPARLVYSGTTQVLTDRAISQFALVRVASSTHSVNTDQRRIPVEFSGSAEGGYSVQMPTDPGIAPPGSYFLFALDDTGVPSVAHIARLGAS